METEVQTMAKVRVQKQPAKLHIRWMIRRDMGNVFDIERESFARPWSEEDFYRALRQRNVIGMVCESLQAGCPECDAVVAGFMIYELLKNGLEVVNFAVHHEFRRQGVGHMMVTKLWSKLSAHRRRFIRMKVREGNLAAQLFWRSQDFRATQVLRSWYEDTGEDAYVMKFQFPGDDQWTP
jgi:ribosomal-protein-alanine N-acetyltransferase